MATQQFLAEQSLTYAPPIGARPETRTPGDPVRRDDATLLNVFLSGDDRAFAELFDRHNQRLFLYCARLLGNAEQAEDIVQALWERVIYLRSTKQNIRNSSAFLLTVARNLCLNHLKRERRRAPFDGEARAACEATGEQKKTDMEEAVLEALDRLPMKYREVLVLNIYSGYDFEEIAGMLGISAAAAWKRASRGREQLRKALERYGSSNASSDTNKEQTP